MAKKELDRYQDWSREPIHFFKDDPKYSAFDEKGIPTTNKDGEPLSKKQIKVATKKFDKHVKNHEKYVKLINENPNYLQDLSKEINTLQDELKKS